MITFPNCKINLGLYVTGRRADGYHTLETAMIPVRGLCDALEILPDPTGKFSFSTSGLSIDAPAEQNLCVRAYRLLKERCRIGGVKIHLHKHVPLGAGLGGGSSDAVCVLRTLDELFGLSLRADELEGLAGELGSDTVFFVKNQPVIATGRGEVLTPFEPDLSGYHLVIAKPSFGVSTAEAYRGIVPRVPERPLAEVLSEDIDSWKTNLKNDFEPVVFRLYPELRLLKESLYQQGAVYASLSGSGSAVFGLFDTAFPALEIPDNYFVYHQNML